MKFEMVHEFPAPRASVESALMEPGYLAFLVQNHPDLNDADLMEQADRGSAVQRKIRYRPRAVIESIGPKKIPPPWLAFIEESIWDRNQHMLSFTNTPEVHALRKFVSNRGTVRYEEDANGATRRRTSVELSISAPLLLRPLAAIAERLIQAEAVKLLDGEAAVLRRWLNERKTSPAPSQSDSTPG